MRLWVIPMIYVAVSAVCGLTLPRIEQAYLGAYTLNLSVASAQAYLSAAASGTMALTGIVFAMAFIMVQFSAIAYSPRLVLAASLADDERAGVVRHYLQQLDLGIEHSPLESEDRLKARQEDRQGLGLSRGAAKMP